MPTYLPTVLQVLIALGLLNVWVVRSASATSYRGKEARSLKEEFAAYGLPEIAYYVVGALKIGSALALLAGIWMPHLVLPAALTIVFLMLGALAMHFKVGDPLKKSLPAAVMLLLSGSLSAMILL